MKDNFKLVDNFITEENGNSHFEYTYTPKRIESNLTKFITDDLETHNTDRAKPYVIRFYRLSKLAGKYNHDLTPYGYEDCKNDTIAFYCDNFVTNALDFCSKLKVDERKVKK